VIFLVNIDVANLKQYLNAIKAKQGVLHARNPLVSGREPHLCSRPFVPRTYRDPPPLDLLLSNLTTGLNQQCQRTEGIEPFAKLGMGL